MFPVKLSGLAVLALLAAGPARAALDAIEMSLDELIAVRIVSTPKFAENPDKIPSAISVLTADDIRAYGWRSLGDALRSLLGFNVTDDHTYAYAGIRGVAQPGDYRPRMQVLVDGVSVVDNLYASAPADSAFPLDIGLVERIEVIRGPSASVYGGDAMFGVINVVTRSGIGMAGSRGAELALAAGSGAQHQLRATWAGSLGGAEAMLSATALRSAGRHLDTNDLTEDGSAFRLRGVGADDGKQLFFKLRGADWRLTVLHAERARTVPTGSYGTIPNDAGHVEIDRYTLLGLAKDWRLDADNLLQSQFNAGHYAYDGDFPYDYSPDDPRLFNVDKARGSWWGIENRWVHTGWHGHRLTLGFEYRANTKQDQRSFDRGYGCFDLGVPTPCLDDHANNQQVSLLVQDEIQAGEASQLTLGLRYDRNSAMGAFWSPRLGLVHDAGTLGLFKALYGFAFRVPTVYELYYSPANFPYGNSSLRPEKMDSLELTWEKRLDAHSRLSLTGYAFEVRRMVFADAATGQAINGVPVRGKGMEFEYETRWRSGAHLRAGYSLQRATQGDTRLDNSPRRMAKVNLALPVGVPHLSAGFETQWIDRRRAAYGTQSIASHVIANLNLSYRPMGRDWEAGFGIYNLFDRRFDDPVSPDITIAGERWRMPQLGRSLRLTLQLRY